MRNGRDTVYGPSLFFSIDFIPDAEGEELFGLDPAEKRVNGK